jgi:hypothetical protein
MSPPDKQDTIHLKMGVSKAFLVLAALRLTHDRMATSLVPAVRDRSKELGEAITSLREELNRYTEKAIVDAVSIAKGGEEWKSSEENRLTSSST